MSHDSESLTPEERRRFDELPLERPAGDVLEARVVRALAGRGLLRTQAPDAGRLGWRRRAARLGGLAVAAAALLAVGFGLGRRTAEPASFPRGQFLLLLHEGPEFERYSEANVTLRFEDYNRWIRGLRLEGSFVTGEQLDSTGMVVRPANGGAVVEERLSSEADGMVDGMFLINARDYAEAVRIARSAPHVRYGGRVAVRRISPI